MDAREKLAWHQLQLFAAALRHFVKRLSVRESTRDYYSRMLQETITTMRDLLEQVRRKEG